MKKLFYLAMVSLIIVSCSTTKETVKCNFEDFSPYQTEDFYVSSLDYSGTYTPVGEISIEAETCKNTSSKSHDQLLKTAINMAKEKGANGLVNYSCKRQVVCTQKANKQIHAYTKYKPVYKEVYVLSGLAVKIENN